MPRKKKEILDDDKIPAAVEPVSGAMSTLFDTIESEVKTRINSSVEKEMTWLHELVKKNAKLDVKIGDYTKTIQGQRHNQLEDLILVAALKLNVLMVGMAGTGKTHAAEQVAEGMGLPFYTMSVGAQTSKSDIMGYMHAGGDYVRSHFREAYENGGVFLMDEIDAGNANVLIQVNSALSNNVCSFPDAMVKRNPDFIFIASANTYGNGANRQYVGRNQLDAATLDRFCVIDWLVDNELEKTLADGNDAWYVAVLAARDYVSEHSIRALVTPRATQKGAQMLASGISVESVCDAVLLASVPEDKKQEIKDLTVKTYRDLKGDN